MSDSYVLSGAGLKCTMGTTEAKLSVIPPHNVKISGGDRANIGDCKPLINIPPFGTCNPKGMPCTPACSIWMGGKMDVLVGGMPALISSSMALCPAGGGVITITDDGQ